MNTPAVSLLRGTVRLRRMLPAALAAVTAELCGTGLIAASAWLIARAAQQPDIAALGLAIVAVRAFATLRGAFRYAERLAGHDVALRAVAELRGRVYDALARRPRNGPGNTEGDALTRLIADTDSIQDLLLRCLLPLTTASFAAVGSVVLFAVLLPVGALALGAGLLVAGVLVPAASARATRHLGRRTVAARARLAARGLDLVDGARDLAAYGATDRARARAHVQAAALARAERRAALVGGLTTGAGILVQGLTVTAVTYLALHAQGGEVLTAVLSLTSLAAVESVLPLSEAAQHWTRVRPALHRVATLMARSDTPVRSRVQRSPEGAVELRGVRVDYDGHPALLHLDLHIDEGRSVAVVGASGAGKSTLLAVLGSLVEPDAGTACLPPSRALTHDAHLFPTSLRANLTLARPHATDRDITAALRTAGLDTWAAALPRGWDTPVGQGGTRLSGGQRQRLALARALLADPPLLLLDEPAEALDTDAADAVVHRVLAARRHRTTVVVTHRLAPLAAFDEVLVMDEGRIADRGRHHDLTRREGPYRDLWQAEQLTTVPRTLDLASRTPDPGPRTPDPAPGPPR
ncbi:thiol reductant ABC exporter subunit CydC [Streptomyces sp. NPDC001941]|uniref:thiol reductant ABC exporter subunit CydC n=1 Tax=Streptomyces sp. NPDC001941 TaxID=3154659 RepID=UPI003322D955